MSEFKTAKLSPRFENGVLCWYRKDTFVLWIHLDLTDQNGKTITLGSEDEVPLTFANTGGRTVKELIWQGNAVPDGRVPLTMDGALSASFSRGRYRMDVQVLHGDRTTVVKGSPIKVE